MVVRKKQEQREEEEQVYEDVIQQPDRIVQFKIDDIERDIERRQRHISNLEEEVAVLEKRKSDALAL